jgi:hypothetical protein
MQQLLYQYQTISQFMKKGKFVNREVEQSMPLGVGESLA